MGPLDSKRNSRGVHSSKPPVRIHQVLLPRTPANRVGNHSGTRARSDVVLLHPMPKNEHSLRVCRCTAHCFSCTDNTGTNGVAGNTLHALRGLGP